MGLFRTKHEEALDQRTTVVLARLERVISRFELVAERLEAMEADELDTRVGTDGGPEAERGSG